MRFMTAAVAVLVASLLMLYALRESKRNTPAAREIGQAAPEIRGEDVNGNPMKLSDFRGKIVVLDFFGDW
jgi:cytochrome oxidase Cu insertion factor (SCO1/SenC/PrrC family)